MVSLDEKKARLNERLRFVRKYAEWVRIVDNETWSREQAKLINSFMENGSNNLMDRDQYLRYVNHVQNLKIQRRKIRSDSNT